MGRWVRWAPHSASRVQLEIDRGPELGRLLADLEEATYAGEVATREEAMRFARRLRDGHPR